MHPLVPPIVSVSLATPVVAALVWYWLHLGSAVIPVSRRLIRRTTIAIFIVSLALAVHGLSFLLPALHRQQFVLTWTLVLLGMLAAILTAVANALNSVRLLAEERQAMADDLRTQLAEKRRDRPDDAGTEPHDDR